LRENAVETTGRKRRQGEGAGSADRAGAGFTLVELLVVIAIIALLMAILLPVLQGVRRQARAVACRANLKQWGQVLSLYAEDHQGRFPHGADATFWILRGHARVPLLLDSPGPSYPIFSEITAPPPREPDPYRNSGEPCINRHSGTINGLFLDWSVASIGLKQLWTLKWYPAYDINGRWTKAGGVKPEDWPKWMRKFKDY
jgi:prepilin-type N-terminal cleavage/methylation domain-containing protein/prepilin-type processing-associated H-X9-DG protein